MKSNHQCVIVNEMMSDALSMDVYWLSDSTDICILLECQPLLAGRGWLQACCIVYQGSYKTDRVIRQRVAFVYVLLHTTYGVGALR